MKNGHKNINSRHGMEKNQEYFQETSKELIEDSGKTVKENGDR